MSPAACFRLCSRDSVWANVFARNARSSLWSASVTVSAGYCLLLVFFNMKPFYRSLNIFST